MFVSTVFSGTSLGLLGVFAEALYFDNNAVPVSIQKLEEYGYYNDSKCNYNRNEKIEKCTMLPTCTVSIGIITKDNSDGVYKMTSEYVTKIGTQCKK